MNAATSLSQVVGVQPACLLGCVGLIIYIPAKPLFKLFHGVSF